MNKTKFEHKALQTLGFFLKKKTKGRRAARRRTAESIIATLSL
jgi:hypothetical protein